MNKALIIAPVVLALAAVAMPAAARDKHRDRHYDRDRHSYYQDRDHDRRWDRDERHAYYRGYRDGRRYDRDRDWDRDRDRDWDRDRRYHPRSGHWDNGRRGPPYWARGRDYRSYGYRNVYFVPYADYPRYRLYRPHHGYRWVRDDHGNFLLVAAATGIITSILLNH